MTTRNATQTANTLHALSRCGSDVQVTLRTIPEHVNTDDANHRCIMCPAKAKEQGAKTIMLGCLLHINGDTVAAAFDTLSEVSVVGPELITPDMQATPGVGVTPVYGVGNGSTQLEGEFRVPVNFRWGEKHNYTCTSSCGRQRNFLTSSGNCE